MALLLWFPFVSIFNQSGFYLCTTLCWLFGGVHTSECPPPLHWLNSHNPSLCTTKELCKRKPTWDHKSGFPHSLTTHTQVRTHTRTHIHTHTHIHKTFLPDDWSSQTKTWALADTLYPLHILTGWTYWLWLGKRFSDSKHSWRITLLSMNDTGVNEKVNKWMNDWFILEMY